MLTCLETKEIIELTDSNFQDEMALRTVINELNLKPPASDEAREAQVVRLGKELDVLKTKQKQLQLKLQPATGLVEPTVEFMLCPLTGLLMSEPVSAADGFIYERLALEKWFAEGNVVSPKTKQPMGSLTFTPSVLMKQLIQSKLDSGNN
jgi:intracellular sulfur oxidation DsrE/DsrF family protein